MTLPLILCLLVTPSSSLHFYRRSHGFLRSVSRADSPKRCSARTLLQSVVQTDSQPVVSDFSHPQNNTVHSQSMGVDNGEPVRSGSVVLALYEAFNNRDIVAAASYLEEDCLYEDLLLGPSTVCRGRDAFASALRFHPAFVTSWLFSGLPFTLPELRLIVDSVAEGVDTVGVEWHVEVGNTPIPLGRGLSQAKLNQETGKIQRVVDIAEAPWRVIGLALAPVVSVVVLIAELATMSE